MKITQIVGLVNTKLAGETLTYSQMLSFLDDTVNDINTNLNACFPTFSEVTPVIKTDAVYDAFPDQYITSVVVIGAAYKFYTTDEEGLSTATGYQMEYERGLFYMVRDYSASVPEEYQAENRGYVEGPSPGGVPHVSFTINPDVRHVEGPRGLTGATGPAGYTPKKGVDYFTEAEIAKFKEPIEEVLQQVKDALASITDYYNTTYNTRIAAHEQLDARHVTTDEKTSWNNSVTAVEDAKKSIEALHKPLADAVRRIDALSHRPTYYGQEVSSVATLPKNLPIGTICQISADFSEEGVYCTGSADSLFTFTDSIDDELYIAQFKGKTANNTVFYNTEDPTGGAKGCVRLYDAYGVLVGDVAVEASSGLPSVISEIPLLSLGASTADSDVSFYLGLNIDTTKPARDSIQVYRKGDLIIWDGRVWRNYLAAHTILEIKKQAVELEVAMLGVRKELSDKAVKKDVDETISEIRKELSDKAAKDDVDVLSKTQKLLEVYGEVIEPSDDSLFEFTLLKDGTYAVAAKKGITLQGDIVIPYEHAGKKVTAINNAQDWESFKGHPIESLVIPNTITLIGRAAFQECYSLLDIALPSSVCKISNYAFYQCRNIYRIVLKEGLQEIGYAAFLGCAGLLHLELPRSLTVLGDKAFDGTTLFTNVEQGIKKKIYYAGTRADFDALGNEATKKELVWHADVYCLYSDDTVLTKGLNTATTDLSKLKSAFLEGSKIKEFILYPGQTFEIKPNSLFVAFPPDKNMELYKADGTKAVADAGIIASVCSEVNSDDSMFRACTIYSQAGILTSSYEASYFYLKEGAYVKYAGNTGYARVLCNTPIETI